MERLQKHVTVTDVPVINPWDRRILVESKVLFDFSPRIIKQLGDSSNIIGKLLIIIAEIGAMRGGQILIENNLILDFHLGKHQGASDLQARLHIGFDFCKINDKGH